MRTHYAVEQGQRFAGDSSLVTVQCWSCGMTYAIPHALYESARKYPGSRRDGWKLFCPLGHEWWYTAEPEEERLRRLLENERARSGHLAAQRDQIEASRRAQKGVTTKLKKRIAAGVCPCCNRSFKDLSRHMTSQHPDFAQKQETEQS